jgi:4-carboxymuconolactone decarboxylase
MGERPSAPRIPPAEPPYSPSIEAILDASKALGGDRPINIFTTMAHHGRALKHVFALGGTFLVAGNLPDRERELIILRVARNTGCEYEYAQHVSIGERAGLTRAEIESIVRDDGDWAPADQVEHDLVDELCADDCVTDATWARLAEGHDERELVELVLVAGYYRMLAGFLNSAGVQLDPGLAGWPSGAAG